MTPTTRRLGKRYTRLLVFAATDARYFNDIVWRCLCDCGVVVDVPGCLLTRGAKKSCGCLRRERGKTFFTKHGERAPRTAEYVAWTNMKLRCLNPNHNSFKRYGGRGIGVCTRWLGTDGYEHFLADMGRKPSNKYSLDRINNGGNYEPGNCRWATAKEQARNRG